MKFVLRILFLGLLSACTTSPQKDIQKSSERFESSVATNPNIHSVYLTWQNADTSSTMVVNYVSFQQATSAKLHYGTDEKKLTTVTTGQYRDIPSTPYYVYSFPLENLQPNTDYFFKVEDEINGVSGFYKFRTLTNDLSPIEIVVGGDMGAIADIPDYAQAVVTNSTRAILIGGDIAYDSGFIKNHKLWTEWFKLMNKSMFTPDGHLLPLVLAIGNHEVSTRRKSKRAVDNVPFYFPLFFQNEYYPYFINYFGKHTVLFTLDSGHWASQSGEQLGWMKEQFEIHKNVPNLLAMYHAPLYPSAREFNNSFSRLGRQHWLPVFDKYALDLAFENHDHTLKRTKMLKGNQPVENNGTVYIGDGCWGQGARKITKEKNELFELLQNKRHLWRVTLSPATIHAVAIDKKGTILDEFEISKNKVN